MFTHSQSLPGSQPALICCESFRFFIYFVKSVTSWTSCLSAGVAVRDHTYSPQELTTGCPVCSALLSVHCDSVSRSWVSSISPFLSFILLSYLISVLRYVFGNKLHDFELRFLYTTFDVC